MRPAVVALLFLAAFVVPSAQTPPIFFNHVDLVARDFDTGKAWWGKHFGAKPDGTIVYHIWFKKQSAPGARQPYLAFIASKTAKPSAGGVINHIAFTVPDVNAKVKELEADGAKLVAAPPVATPWKSAFVDDQSGVRIELVEEPGPISFHHVHLRLPDPAGARKWLQDTFGGQPVKVKTADALQFGGVEAKVLIDKGESVESSEGRALDHIAFRLQQAPYDALVTRLKAGNTPFRFLPFGYKNSLITGTTAKVFGPAGALVEMLSRTPDYVPAQ